ncbi:hypothetical protein C8F04DRAFT_558867 [Mycena alexandri]|uniref:Uncharacterized protein n=1 Tax=Mycena alexandri TaxID=1745969 RepID=A0AAD6SXL7_9AGAR|nr:hypothetical protein C8F04DRAFT_558867 [Mycena alexandri]
MVTKRDLSLSDHHRLNCYCSLEMIVLNSQDGPTASGSNGSSEPSAENLPDYIASNRAQPPRYSRVRRPKNPLSYTFVPPRFADDPNSMVMVPPEEADDQGQYRISVSLNLNPFVPVSYRTTVHRLEGPDESFIGDFELSLNHRRAIITIGDITTRLSNVLFNINASPRHWTWRWDEIGLRWDCRSTLEDGSPMCIVAAVSSPCDLTMLTYTSQCYTIASPVQLASFVPPPLDAPPPLPEAVLTVFPDGHECFDHILLSALILQRKIGLEY